VDDNFLADAAPMIDALNARAHVAGEIRLSDGMELDIEGVACRAWVLPESEVRMISGRDGPSRLMISVEGEENEELHDLDRGDHGYVVIPLNVLPSIVKALPDERWPAGAWRLEYDLDGSHVELMIRKRVTADR
jgi:hypothetical protein